MRVLRALVHQQNIKLHYSKLISVLNFGKSSFHLTDAETYLMPKEPNANLPALIG